MMRTTILVAMSVVLLGGCATKGFVTETVEDRAAALRAQQVEADARIAELQTELDASEATIEQQGAQLREVDETATNAFALATSAGAAASDAQEAADAVELANRRLVFEVVVADQHDQFGFGVAMLPEPARLTLDSFVERLRELPSAAFLEIEGHTDATGAAGYNTRLGLERAESVRRYLHERHELPLHKMSVISYGEDQPIASNDDRDGRARNRRVVVRVLS